MPSIRHDPNQDASPLTVAHCGMIAAFVAMAVVVAVAAAASIAEVFAP